MIQFNLLPDVKLEYVKAQRTKNTVISAATIAAGSAFAVFLLLFLTVHVAQHKNISDLNSDIKKYGNELKNTPDLDKTLTIQSQLGALPALHAGKPTAARTFGFIEQVTPANVTLTDVTADYTANTLSITGQASNLDQVNTYADTLKFTKYSTSDVSGKTAFSGVVLAQFSRTATGATFTITLSFDPAIFDNAENAVLSVPTTISTRSVVEQPANVFNKATGSN